MFHLAKVPELIELQQITCSGYMYKVSKLALCKHWGQALATGVFSKPGVAEKDVIWQSTRLHLCHTGIQSTRKHKDCEVWSSIFKFSCKTSIRLVYMHHLCCYVVSGYFRGAHALKHTDTQRGTCACTYTIKGKWTYLFGLQSWLVRSTKHHIYPSSSLGKQRQCVRSVCWYICPVAQW